MRASSSTTRMRLLTSEGRYQRAAAPGGPAGQPKKTRSFRGVLAYPGVPVGGGRSLQAMNDKDALKNDAAKNDAAKTDKRKQSLYFPESMLQEIKEEAARLDRSLSWVVQRAWKLARLEIKRLPSVNDVNGDEDDTGE